MNEKLIETPHAAPPQNEPRSDTGDDPETDACAPELGAPRTDSGSLPADLPRRRRRLQVLPARLGRGVFAQRTIEADDVIGRVRGRLTRDPDLDPDYTMHLEGELYLIPHAPFRYLNHSCDPNCELFSWDHDREARKLGYFPLYVGSKRRIEAGEELTIDYGWAAEFAIPCRCESERCRGWIVDEEELVHLKRRQPR